MVSNKGFNEGIITLYAGDDITVGAPVIISENDTCSTAADGDSFVGVIINKRSGIGSVQIMGFVKVPYSGTAPELGITEVAANGEGGIKAQAGGRIVTVLNVDTDNSTAEILI